MTESGSILLMVTKEKNHTCFETIRHFKIILNDLNLIGDPSGF